MKMLSRRVATWLGGAALVLLVSAPGGAHHAVLRFNLEEMTLCADRIFVGRCVAVDETTDLIAQGRLPVTRYTFEVERALKGSIGRRLAFTQLGHPARRALGKGGEVVMHGNRAEPSTFFHGMSEYREGDRAVLFLIPNYLGGKVTYPVGLYQGAFSISTMPSGRELVRNSINNLGLFTAPYNGTAMKAADARVLFPDRDATVAGSLARKRGALPLEEFLEVVERIHAAHGGVSGKVVQR
jgi:hypothetical protein